MTILQILVCTVLLVLGGVLWLTSAGSAERIIASASDPDSLFMFESRRRFWLRRGIGGTRRLLRLYASGLIIVGVAIVIASMFGHAHF